MTVSSVTGLDHIILQAENLDVLRDTYAKLGFKLTNRGFHPRGSSNHTAIFDDNYLELIHVPLELRQGGGGFAALSEGFEGLRAIGLKSPSSQRTHDDLAALGYEVSPTGDGGRPVVIEGHGTFDAKWVSQRFPDDAPSLPPLFTCQHLTRDLVHRNDYRDHPNGALSIRDVNFVHPDPSGLAAVYEKLFGKQAQSVEATGFTTKLGVTNFRFHTPAAFQARFPGIALPSDLSKGWFAGATIAVKSIDGVAKLLKAAGVPVLATPAGGIVPDPKFSASAVIEFRQV